MKYNKYIFTTFIFIAHSLYAMDVPLLAGYEKTISPEEQDKLNQELFNTVGPYIFDTKATLVTAQDLLTKKAQVNVLDKHEFTPLGIAALGGNAKICELLLDHNADIERGIVSPLMIASRKGNDAACKLLLDRGAQIENPKNPDITPLEMAIEKGRGSTCKLLLEYGARIDRRDYFNRTVLTFALYYHPSLLRILIPCALFNPFPQPFSNIKQFVQNGSLDPETTVAQIKKHHIECLMPLMTETMLLAKRKETLELLNPARIEQNFGDTIEQVIRERLGIVKPKK